MLPLEEAQSAVNKQFKMKANVTANVQCGSTSQIIGH